MMAELLALLLALAACLSVAPLGTLNGLAAVGARALVREAVPYGAHERHKLDIYTPASAAPAGGWPLVVFFYGGSWNSGARADYAFVGRALAARGVLTLVADYRLYPEVRYPDFLHDCARALAWGLDEAARLGANPRRVFVMGHSAGAYNAAMLALDPRWLAGTGHVRGELAGWVGLAGPYDFFPTANPDAQPVFFHPHYPAQAQPIDWVSAQAPASFVAAPVADKLVSPTRSTQGLATKLRAAGVPVTLQLYERASHMTIVGALAWPLAFVAPVLDDVVAFVDAVPPASAAH